jgi:hypothetical protein
VAAVHRFEDVFASALDWDVDELVNAFVRKAVEECFLVAEDVTRVSHAEADAVIAADVRQDSLREFRKIRADVKSVAGAVLAGELDFEASVIDERLDLIDYGLRRKAVEPAFDEVRAAKSTGV